MVLLQSLSPDNVAAIFRESPSAIAALGVAALIGVYALLSWSFQTTLPEPPQAPTMIPYLGHVIGLMRHKYDYYVQLKQKVRLPIFTMTLPGQKMYIVTTPEAIQAVQKVPKALAFRPVQAKFAARVCGCSEQAEQVVLTNVNGDEGNWGISEDLYGSMRMALLPGVHLDDMNRILVQEIAVALDNVEDQVRSGKGSAKLQLSEWLRKVVTLATTNSVYGEDNPYKSDELVELFWTFEQEIMTILLGFFPSILARKGSAAREKIAQAFVKYYEAGGHNKASTLTRLRYEDSIKNGLTVLDTARFEVGGSIAVLVNTAPAAFWMLLLMYAHPGLLEEVRAEVTAVMTSERDERTGEEVRRLDITSLKESCPLLTSTYQEVLRFRSMGTSVREVVQDTPLLGGQFVLRKGALVQMPSRVVHKDSGLWGADVDDFNPRRFMRETKPSTSTGKKAPATAFRAFGGGTTLCPGRHFATNEVLAVVVMFAMRFEMAPASGEWVLPSTERTNVASVVMEPDNDIDVEIKLREGFEKGRWEFGLRTSDKIFAVAAEDRE